MSDLTTKIKKLLALSTSSNVAESMAALGKAQAMLKEAGLTLTQIQYSEIKETEIKSFSVLQSKIDYYFLRVLSNLYGLKCLKCQDKTTLVIGRESSIAVLEPMLEYLNSTLKRLCKKAAEEAKKNNTWSRSFTEEYKLHFAVSLVQRVESQASEYSGQEGLVYIQKIDPILAQYFAENHRVKQKKTLLRGGAGAEAGTADSKTVSLAPQVNTTQSLRLNQAQI